MSRAKTERLLTFVLYLMQLPEGLEAEMKSFYRKNKKTSVMAATTDIKPTPRSKKERLADDTKFVRDLSYEFAYGKSHEEIYEIVYDEAKDKIATEQAKRSITTMFQKTGWSADKIADIGGFSLDLVQKTVAELNA